MLVISSASAAGVRYWQRSAVHSMWLGEGSARLGLAGQEIDGGALRDLLAGRHPGGEALTNRPGLRRRQGWDLVFGAPKSVSLLASAGEGAAAGPVRLAFRQAVADAFTVLEQRAASVYRQGGREKASGLVAGAFEHMSGGTSQPHLHAHVVLANLAGRGDGQWGCLVGAELWRWREGIGACFQLALRAHLASTGLSLDWEVGPGGLGEIVGVSRQVRSAASGRSLATRAGALWFGATSPAANRVSQGRGHASALTSPPGRQPQAPQPHLGLPLAPAGPGTGLPPPPPSPDAVAHALAEQRSSFGEPDVLVALAETCPAGLPAALAVTWATTWCQAGGPAATRAGVQGAGVQGAGVPKRWTTSLARHFDRQVAAAALEGQSARCAQVAPALAWQEVETLGFTAVAARAGVELACSGRAIDTVPRAPWLEQAACIDAARAAWQAAGMTVLVATPSGPSARRWRALTSLRPAEGGGWGRPGRRVLVVDAAHRIGPAGLARLVAQASASETKLVLVPGGTVPGYGESMAASLDDLVARTGGPSLDDAWPSMRAPAMTAPNPAVSVPGLAVQGAFTGFDAATQTVSAWLRHAGTGQRALMVALGPPEAEALNLAARRALGLAGREGEVVFGGRAYAPGEAVMALRRIGDIRAATRGVVVATAPGSLAVRWDRPGGAEPTTVHRGQAGDLGYGYATTLPYSRGAGPGQAFLVLGDPLALSGRSPCVAGAWVTVAGPGMPAPGTAGVERRWQAAVGELATGWPDEQILLRAGPRPLSSAARGRWERAAKACALERIYGWERAESIEAVGLRRGPASAEPAHRAPALRQM